MSDYFNRKADLNRGMPTGKGLNGLGGQQGVVHWDDVDDAGINLAERNANLAAAQKTVAHPFTSIASGVVSQSVLGATALKMNEADFPPNAEFSAAQALLDAPQWQTQKYNQEETDYLTKARSDEEFQYRIERVEKYRTMTDLGNDNPISSLVGAFLGDAPFMFAPQAATSATFKIRSVIRAAELGTTMYSTDQLGMNGGVTALIAGAIGLDHLWDMKSTGKALRGGTKASDVEAGGIKTGDTGFGGETAYEGPAKASGILSDAPEIEPTPEVPEVPTPFTPRVPDPDAPVEPIGTVGVEPPKVKDEPVPEPEPVPEKTPEPTPVDPDEPVIGSPVQYDSPPVQAPSPAPAKVQPTPKVKPEPKPEPTPEPVPEPKPEPTPAPEPAVEVTPEPTLRKPKIPVKTPADPIDFEKPSSLASAKKFVETKLAKPVRFRSTSGRTKIELGTAADVVGSLVHNVGKMYMDTPTMELLKAIPASILKQIPIKAVNRENVSVSGTSKVAGTYSYALPRKLNEGVLGYHGDIEVGMKFGDESSDMYTINDVLRCISGHTIAHEIIHSATSIFMAGDDWLRMFGTEAQRAVFMEADAVYQHAKRIMWRDSHKHYGFQSVKEFYAELSNPVFRELLSTVPYDSKLSFLDKALELIARVLGVGGKRGDNALDAAINALSRMYDETAALDADGVIPQLSKAMGDSFKQVDNAVVVNGKQTNEVTQAKQMYDGVAKTLTRAFSLYENVKGTTKAQEDLANLLITNSAKQGMQQSVNDIKRLAELDGDMRVGLWEDAVRATMQAQGIKPWEQFFNTQRFQQMRAQINKDVSMYMRRAEAAYKVGAEVPPVPDNIKGIIDSITGSDWAKQWRTRAESSTLLEKGVLEDNPFYQPRRYSYTEMRRHKPDLVKSLMEKEMAESYPSMDKTLAKKVARQWYERVMQNGRSADGNWRTQVKGMSVDDIEQAMLDVGMDREQIDTFLYNNFHQSGTGGQQKNLRKRTEIDVARSHIMEDSDGNLVEMSLSSLMDNDFIKNAQAYNRSMSGRVALAEKGFADLHPLDEMITAAKSGVDNGADWATKVDDVMDYILGYPVVGGDIPTAMRCAQNVASTVMLKNSALYQLTDISLAMKEFGMARVLRGLMKGGLFRKASMVAEDGTMATRLHNILNSSMQTQARYKYLSTFTEDALDLTQTSQTLQITQNAAALGRLANGFAATHRMTANLVSGIVADDIQAALTTGRASQALQNFGMTDDVLKELKAAADAAGEGMALPFEAQQKLELIGTALIDQMLQNIRMGDTSHFAQFTPVGKAMIGYMSFGLAAQNKILRRYANEGAGSMAMLFAYQFPLMALASMAKHGMDGKESDPESIIKDSVTNMSMLGGGTIFLPWMTGETPRHSMVATAYPLRFIQAAQSAAKGELDLTEASNVVPFVQEIAPLRALINNFGD